MKMSKHLQQDDPWLTRASLREALALYIEETHPVGPRLPLQRLDRAGLLTTVSVDLPLYDYETFQHLDFLDAAYYKVDPDSGMIAIIGRDHDLLGMFCEAIVFGSPADLHQHIDFTLSMGSLDEYQRTIKKWVLRRHVGGYFKADRPKDRNAILKRIYEIIDAS
jgi:hypothetical protein